MAAPKAKNPLKDFRTKIRGSMVKSEFDRGQFLPECKISKLVIKDVVGSLLPDERLLVEFVCKDARKIFLIAL